MKPVEAELLRAVAPRRPGRPVRDGRRRPSGHDLSGHRRVPAAVLGWTALFAAALFLLVLVADEPVSPIDRAIRHVLEGGGDSWRSGAWRWLETAGGVLSYRVVWLPVTLVLVWSARWRHLALYLGTVWMIAAAAVLAGGDARLAEVVREGVTGSTADLLLPAWPVVVLSAVTSAGVRVLTPTGPWRRRGWAVACAFLLVSVATRVALGLDSAVVSLASACLGAAPVAVAFLLLAPESEFPVTYRRMVKAHLRLDGERTDRIRAAVREQLGLTLTELAPYRLDGSAGSTPCRLSIVEPPGELFGKLYATNHLRSDRWYKLVRVLRYGRLEDEAPFSSVRRLVEHEDYMLRLLRDGAVRVPQPLGVVEVLSGEEYLLVTELVPGAVEMLSSPLDDDVVDDALDQIRRLWAAGAAHRDIKPSNVLVQGPRVYLVDVSFGELRPSPWRQAVDLANMLLILGLGMDPSRVFERAARYFSPAELAEAFASSGSLTVPRQLRRRIEATGRDLLGEFTSLAPPHAHVHVQRWSVRRLLLAVATVGGLAGAAVLVAVNLRVGGLL